MRSHEVLKRATDRIGVKSLAAKLRLSPALIYKWCQDYDPDDPDASGARNPLDRLADIVATTEDAEVVNWLCHEANGFFVSNPEGESDSIDTELLVNLQRLVNDFSKMLVTVTRSIEDDGMIDCKESDGIRISWELLKATTESFVVACERGRFDGSAEA